MNANELANELERPNNWQQENNFTTQAATMLRQQQNEIEDLKSANRFIQNFAEEQHKRAVALEMREITDEEIQHIQAQCHLKDVGYDGFIMRFARAIMKRCGIISGTDK